MNNIVKKDPLDAVGPSFSLGKGKLVSKASPFQQRVAQAKEAEADADKMPNRVCLMLDCSSSMNSQDNTSSKKIDLLNDAVHNFILRCNFNDTAIAIESFPKDHSLPLSRNQTWLTHFARFVASGSTPMRECLETVLESVPLTRGVIVSDGEATDWGLHTTLYDNLNQTASSQGDALLQKFKISGVPIDCVHIGSSTGGEELLKKIAETTGGIFIKFKDVSAFSTAFAYLTPGLRGMLTDGSVKASSLGADEVRS